MTDLTVTAANVIPVVGAQNVFEDGPCLEAVGDGKLVYYDEDTGTYGLYDANGASATIRTLRGICVAGSAINQRISVQTKGSVALGAILTQGRLYVGSATPGGIAPSADIATGWYTSFLGMALSTSVLKLAILNGGIAAS